MATLAHLPSPAPEAPDADFGPRLTALWAKGLLQGADPSVRIATTRRHGFPAVAAAMEGLARSADLGVAAILEAARR